LIVRGGDKTIIEFLYAQHFKREANFIPCHTKKPRLQGVGAAAV